MKMGVIETEFSYGLDQKTPRIVNKTSLKTGLQNTYSVNTGRYGGIYWESEGGNTAEIQHARKDQLRWISSLFLQQCLKLINLLPLLGNLLKKKLATVEVIGLLPQAYQGIEDALHVR